MNLAQDCLEKSAARIPNRPAVIDYETAETLTYAELNKKVNRLANGLLSMGVEKGDRVEHSAICDVCSGDHENWRHLCALQHHEQETRD